MREGPEGGVDLTQPAPVVGDSFELRLDTIKAPDQLRVATLGGGQVSFLGARRVGKKRPRRRLPLREIPHQLNGQASQQLRADGR